MTASPPPPRFIFSHATDSSLPPELTSTEYAICTPSAGLGAPRERSRYDGDDDDVPAYGPTTHRRGPMRFVRASDGGLGVLAASRDEADGTDQAVDRNREGEAVKAEADDDVIIVEPPPPAPKEKASGGTVRGLYESIVGLGTPLSTSVMTRGSLSPAHIPGTSRSTGLPSSQSSYALFRQPSSMPPSPPHRVKDEYDDGFIVISPSPPPARRRMRRPSPPIPVDAELLILDPNSRLPLPARSVPTPVNSSPAVQPTAFSLRPPSHAKRARPQQIHQLLPSPSTAPLALPTHYKLKPDNPGWRLLEQQGWKEGAVLGPSPAGPAGEGRGEALKVPLRAIEKHDRLGLGAEGTTKEALARLTPLQREVERNRREAEDLLERARRGKGARGMDRVRKREEKERKAMLGYMNR